MKLQASYIGLILGATISTAVLFAASASAQAAVPASDSTQAVQGKLERTRELLKDVQGEKGKAGEASLGEDLTHTGYRVFEGLLLCLGVLAIGVYLAKRFGLKGAVSAGRKIKIVERTPLSARTSLVLAQVEGKSILLAVGPDNVSFVELKDGGLYGDAVDLAALASGKEA